MNGAPDIAYPDDGDKWETQRSFVLAWVFEMLDRVECDDQKVGREARAELQTLFLNLGGQFLRVALAKNDADAKKWAGRMLADIFVSIGKHAGKVKIEKPYRELMKNDAFRKEKTKIGKLRINILFPAQVCAITQRELKTAARHRRTLLLLKAGCVSEHEQKRRERLAEEHGFQLANHERGTTWKQAAERQNIPQAYWSLVKFPEFSNHSLDEWFSFLWPLISKKIDLAELESRYELARKRAAADSQNTARGHLRTLAMLRDKGIFYFF